MASFFCSSVLKPGLLGQLILATVATHAALNSSKALGIFWVDISLLTVFLGAVQENSKPKTVIAITGKKYFFIIYLTLYGYENYFKSNLKKYH